MTAVATKPRVRLTATSAWFEYLSTTKMLTGDQYAEAESWAWARLKARLRYVRNRDK